jgi:hypothetical protein
MFIGAMESPRTPELRTARRRRDAEHWRVIDRLLGERAV